MKYEKLIDYYKAEVARWQTLYQNERDEAIKRWNERNMARFKVDQLEMLVAKQKEYIDFLTNCSSDFADIEKSQQLREQIKLIEMGGTDE